MIKGDETMNEETNTPPPLADLDDDDLEEQMWAEHNPERLAVLNAELQRRHEENVRNYPGLCE